MADRTVSDSDSFSFSEGVSTLIHHKGHRPPHPDHPGPPPPPKAGPRLVAATPAALPRPSLRRYLEDT